MEERTHTWMMIHNHVKQQTSKWINEWMDIEYIWMDEWMDKQLNDKWMINT